MKRLKFMKTKPVFIASVFLLIDALKNKLHLIKIACAILICVTIKGIAHAETLTILHTNDLHSRIEPINKYNSACSLENNLAGKCFGGWAG